MQTVRVYAPASIGNIGPGFDVLGLAVTNLGDVVEARRRRSPGVSIIDIKGDGGKLPVDPAKNTASIAAAKVLERIGAKGGANIVIEKGVPFPSGLGSSAAGAVAGGVAANLLFGDKLPKDELLLACTEAEAAVSGGFFADNTAAALFGGCVVSSFSDGKFKLARLGGIPDAAIILATPEFPMPTKKSRAVLPKTVPMKDFVSNMANTALIVAAFAKKDAALFGSCIDDRIVEPARRKLIPGFDDVKAAALGAGALGCSISGGGASIFAVARKGLPLDRIGEAMKRAFKNNGLESKIHICNIDTRGARAIGGK